MVWRSRRRLADVRLVLSPLITQASANINADLFHSALLAGQRVGRWPRRALEVRQEGFRDETRSRRIDVAIALSILPTISPGGLFARRRGWPSVGTFPSRTGRRRDVRQRPNAPGWQAAPRIAGRRTLRGA